MRSSYGSALERESNSWKRRSVVSAKPHPTGTCGQARLQGKWLDVHAWGVDVERLKVIEVAGHNQAAASR
jgi:hypothetical protein